MNIAELLKKHTSLVLHLKENLTPRRYRHSLCVAELSAELCLRWGEETNKGFLAGLLHDLAREYTAQQILTVAGQYNLPVSSYEKEHPVLLHASVAAEMARREWKIRDEQVLQAVRDHITGRPGMGMLSRILFLADYLEPSRHLLPEEERQKVLHKECDSMLLYVIEQMQTYYAAKNLPVTTETRDLYREIRNRIGDS